MFGSIGIGELILIAGVALVFLGPDRFPEFAKIVARTVRDLRGYVEEAKRDIGKELKPVKDEMQKLSQIDPEAYIEKLAGAATGDSEGKDAPAAGGGIEGGPGDDWYDVPDDSEDSGDNKEELGPMPEGLGVDTSFDYNPYGGDPPGDEEELKTPSEEEDKKPSGEEDKTPSGEKERLPERLDG